MTAFNTTELTIASYTKVNDGNRVVEDTNLRQRRKIINIAQLIKQYNLDHPTTPITKLTTNDLVAAVPVFIGELVRAVFTRVITASTATSAGAIGDAVSGLPAALSTGWLSTFTLSTPTQTTATPPVLQNGGVIAPDVQIGSYLAGVSTITAISAFGKMHYANGSIDLKILTTGASVYDGVFEVIALLEPLINGAAN